MAFKKIMKVLFLQILIVTIIFGIIHIQDAEAQSNMRQFLCEVFNCQQFVDLGVMIMAIKQDTETILTNQDAIQTNQATMDGKLDGIAAEFPIIVQPDPAAAEALARIERRLGYFAKSEQSIWIEPGTAATGQTVAMPILIRGESLREIDAWGFDLTFDTAYFSYVGMDKGELTQQWDMVGANEITAGTLRIGGIRGAGPLTVGDVIGDIVILRFTVNGMAATSQICLINLVDDFATYTTAPPCADFILE